MKVGSGGNLGLSREYDTQLFRPMFHSRYNCPLIVFNPYCMSDTKSMHAC